MGSLSDDDGSENVAKGINLHPYFNYFPLRANCWIRGGVGGQFPR